MRPILLCLALCLAFQSFGQWRMAYDGTNSNNEIKSASFINPSTGYIATQDWIGFTTDSGHTFQQRPITMGIINFNNYPVNLLFGFAVEDIHAFSVDTLLVSGDFGLEPSILYSTNGGASWLVVFHRGIPFNTVNIFNSMWQMEFPQRGSIGYAVHGDQVLKTTNRGQSWQVALLAENQELFDVSFVNSQFGFAAGPNRLMKTTNGGTNWTIISNLNVGILELFAFSEQYVFINTSNGDNFYSNNGGTSWIQANTPVSQLTAYDIHYVNDSTGYAATSGIYQTRNRGKTWELMPGSYTSGGNYAFTKFRFFNDQLGWACTPGEDLFITTNGGGISHPVALFEVNSSSVCTNNQISLINQSHSNYTYQWFRNDVLFATTYNASYTAGSTGENIKLVVSNGTETDTMVQFVDAVASSALTIQSVARYDTACSNSTAIFDIFNSRPDVQYQVGRPCCGFQSPQFGNGGTLTLWASTNSGEDSNSTFTITAYVNGPCGIQTASAQHTVRIIRSNPPATGVSDTICTQNVFYITITDSRAGYQYWADPDFPKVNGNGGSIQVPCRVARATSSFVIDPSGLLTRYVFPVFARHIARGCGGESPVVEVIMIGRRSSSNFDVLGHEWMTGDNMGFQNLSKQSETYLWRFPDGGNNATSTQREPININYTTSGFKMVKLIAITREGCLDSATRSIEVYNRDATIPGETVCPGSNGTVVDSLKERKYYVTRCIYEDEYGSRIIGGGYTDLRFTNGFYPRGYEGWFATKYDKDGQVKWSLSQTPGDDYFTFNQNSHIIVEQVVGDSLGYTYLLGHSFNRLRITAQSQDTFLIPRTCTFLMRISPAGRIIWVKTMNNKHPFTTENSLDYSGGSLLRGKNNDIYVVTHRHPGAQYFVGNTRLYDFNEGLTGILFHMDKDGNIIRQRSFPIKENNMRRFNIYTSDSYDSLAKARWGAGNKLVVYGELNPAEMVGNSIDGVTVPFSATAIPNALLFFDTTNLQVTSIRPLYKNSPSGMTGLPLETFTVDAVGNYFASYSGRVRIPQSSLAYQNDTLKPKSFINGYNSAGVLQWTKQAEGLQPKSMEMAGGLLKIAGTNYTYTGFTNGNMIYYSNQSPTYHSVKKLTMLGDSSSMNGAGSYGPGSLDLLVASIQPSNGQLVKLQHLGSNKEDESMVMSKGYGDQLWMAGTVGSSIRNVINFIDTSSTVYTYKIAVDNNCNTTYRILAPFVKLDIIGNTLNCTDSTYKLFWSSNGVGTVNISFSTNGGANYTNLVSGVNAGAGNYSFNAIQAGATGMVKFRIQDAGNSLMDTVTVRVTAKVRPLVNIAASSSTICTGETVTFTATPTNGGTTPSYQWFINNAFAGTNSATFVWSSFSNGQQVRVEMTSNAACAEPVLAGSNVIAMTVGSSVTPSVSVTGTTTVNQGQATLITANPVGGGASPAYQWQDSTLTHNWQNIPGATAVTLNYTPAASGVKLRCVLTSSASCATTPNATSAPITFIVNTPTGVTPVPGNNIGVHLYPNPTTDLFIIDTLRLAEKWETLEIVSMDGRHRYLNKSVRNQQRVSVSIGHLPGGVYIVVLRRKSGLPVYLKVVKQ